jgi:mono/diheme cytochrome c family protein
MRTLLLTFVLRLVLPLVVVVAGACTASSPGFREATTTLSPHRDASDVTGERLYRGHCGACHALRDPYEHTAPKWAAAMDEYGQEAHLSVEEQQLVLSYLVQRARPGTDVR